MSKGNTNLGDGGSDGIFLNEINEMLFLSIRFFDPDGMGNLPSLKREQRTIFPNTCKDDYEAQTEAINQCNPKNSNKTALRVYYNSQKSKIVFGSPPWDQLEEYEHVGYIAKEFAPKK